MDRPGRPVRLHLDLRLPQAEDEPFAQPHADRIVGEPFGDALGGGEVAIAPTAVE
jgi:hypothetical protein